MSDQITVTLPIERYNRLLEIEKEAGEVYRKYRVGMELLRINHAGRVEDAYAFLNQQGYRLDTSPNEFKLNKITNKTT